MNANLDFFTLYAEIMMAFLAFTTIMVTLRQSMVGSLLPIQYMLFCFFIETGLLAVLKCFIPIALFSASTDELLVWRISTYVGLFAVLLYVPFYVRRRKRLVPGGLPRYSLFVMGGYGIDITVLAITATGIFWPPSQTTFMAHLSWGLAANMTVFVVVLSSLVTIHSGDRE